MTLFLLFLKNNARIFSARFRKIRKKSVFDFEHKGRLAVNGRRSSNIARDHSGARLSETLTTLFLGPIFFQFTAQAVLVFF